MQQWSIRTHQQCRTTRNSGRVGSVPEMWAEAMAEAQHAIKSSLNPFAMGLNFFFTYTDKWKRDWNIRISTTYRTVLCSCAIMIYLTPRALDTALARRRVMVSGGSYISSQVDTGNIKKTNRPQTGICLTEFRLQWSVLSVLLHWLLSRMQWRTHKSQSRYEALGTSDINWNSAINTGSY